VQIVEEEDEFAFDFDLLDPTKIIPEELVPVKIIGKMVLNRNPENFFAETEQVAFHPGNVVPGIDFTNDPLLQGRLFSYLDTQLIRLGGPNFAEIPINRPVVKVNNNQRDGFMRQTINRGQTSYSPNSLRDGDPVPAPEEAGGFVHYAEKVEGHKIRARHESFGDHYGQARLFWNSQTDYEKQHMIDGFHFELGKVENMAVRQRMVDHLAQIDGELAQKVAEGIGVEAPTAIPVSMTQSKREERVPVTGKRSVDKSEALSTKGTRKDTIYSRRIAILVSDGVEQSSLTGVKKALEEAGAHAEIISKNQGMLRGNDGGSEAMEIDKNFVTTGSIMYDAVFVPGGIKSVEAMKQQGDALHFITEAFKHCKTVAAYGEGVDLLSAAHLINVELAGQEHSGVVSDKGVVTARGGDISAFAQEFIQTMTQHRHWERDSFKKQLPA
jgi:catalase